MDDINGVFSGFLSMDDIYVLVQEMELGMGEIPGIRVPYSFCFVSMMRDDGSEQGFLYE